MATAIAKTANATKVGPIKFKPGRACLRFFGGFNSLLIQHHDSFQSKRPYILYKKLAQKTISSAGISPHKSDHYHTTYSIYEYTGVQRKNNEEEIHYDQLRKNEQESSEGIQRSKAQLLGRCKTDNRNFSRQEKV
jgi:hypothetical protein